jgi:hypothetical protein
MRYLTTIAVILALGIFAFGRYKDRRADRAYEAAHVGAVAGPAVVALPPEGKYLCDGRVYCSQMTSCEEAEYFLRNCPGVKMDGQDVGKSDGVPCERQWCGDR